MKAFRLCLLSTLLCGVTAFAAPPPANLAGGYQALLYTGSGDTGSPAGLLTLTVTTKGGFSGKLTSSENKVYGIKGTLSYEATAPLEAEDPIGTATTVPATISIARKGSTPLDVILTIKDYGEEAEPVLTVRVQEESENVALTDNGFRVKTYAKGETVPTLGSYTMGLEHADTPDSTEPAGSGFATGAIDAKGNFKLTGKLGDGTAFTAALPNGASNQFVLFVNPYKRADSFLAGKINLSQRSDLRYRMLPAETGYDFQWQKAAGAKDKAYPLGFNLLNLTAAVERWIPPAKGQSLGDLLGLGLDKSFAVAFSGGLPSARTPTSLALDIKNNLQVVTGASGSPSTLIGTGWSKIFTGKIDAKTGKVTMTINLEDSVPTSNPLRPKLVKRKVMIEGVILVVQVAGEEEFRFAPGFMLIPPLNATTSTAKTYALELQGPAVLNELFTAAGELAGTYTATLKLDSITPSGAPSPAVFSINTPATFTISADLKTLTIGGRKLPLVGDSRPTSLVYTDSQTKYTNYYSVIIQLKFDGKPNTIVINHHQNIYAIPPVVKDVVYSSTSIVKQ